MSVSTPICNFGEKSHDFSLKSTEGKLITLDDIKGENGYLIMFICNHCPYVQAIINFLVDDVKYLQSIGIKSAAIMSNDTKNYPEECWQPAPVGCNTGPYYWRSPSDGGKMMTEQNMTLCWYKIDTIFTFMGRGGDIFVQSKNSIR